MRPNIKDCVRLGDGQGYKVFAANLKQEMGWKKNSSVPDEWHSAWMRANAYDVEVTEPDQIAKQITINTAKKDLEGSVRVTGKAQMISVIKGNDITVNMDKDSWHKLEDIYWQMLAFVKTIRFTSEDLGNAWLVEVGK